MTSNRSNSPALVLPSRFNLHPALEAVPAQGCTISPRRRCNALRLWARQEGSKGRRTKIAVWYGPTALGEYSVAIRYILDRSVASTPSARKSYSLFDDDMSSQRGHGAAARNDLLGKRGPSGEPESEGTARGP